MNHIGTARLVAALCVLLGTGCPADEGLRVDLYTDLVSGVDFDAVRVSNLSAGTILVDQVAPTDALRFVSSPLPLAAQMEDGDHLVEFELRREGLTVLSSRAFVQVRGATGISVALMSSCLDVECDAATPNCLNGVCVPESCTTGVEPSCVAAPSCDECTPPTSPCLEPVCLLGGVCGEAMATGACAEDEYCYADGCRAIGGVAPDGGADEPDAGLRDGGVDAGSRDAATVDGAVSDAGYDAGPVDAGYDAGPVDAGYDGGYDAGYDGGYDAGPAMLEVELSLAPVQATYAYDDAVWISATLRNTGGAPASGEVWVRFPEPRGSFTFPDRTADCGVPMAGMPVYCRWNYGTIAAGADDTFIIVIGSSLEDETLEVQAQATGVPGLVQDSITIVFQE